MKRPTLILGTDRTKQFGWKNIMNTETQKQADGLRALADYIEKNPKKFSQIDKDKCIVGLGVKLVGNRLLSKRGGSGEAFEKRYGINEITATNLFVGAFKDINTRLRAPELNWGETFTAPEGNAAAVAALRYLASKKEKAPNTKKFFI